LIRASIHLRKILAKAMDCRVKPGNDTFVIASEAKQSRSRK
jgi:hypothetical protein